MKKVLFILCAIVLMVACTSQLPKKFTALADEVEKKGESFSEEQWEKAIASFDKLVEEYEQTADKLNEEQKAKINDAIGRFRAAQVKAGLSKMGNALNEIGDTVKGFLNGLGGGDDEDQE